MVSIGDLAEDRGMPFLSLGLRILKYLLEGLFFLARLAPQLATSTVALYRLNISFAKPQHPSPIGANPHPQSLLAVTFSALFQRILEELFEGRVIITHVLCLCIFVRRVSLREWEQLPPVSASPAFAFGFRADPLGRASTLYPVLVHVPSFHPVRVLSFRLVPKCVLPGPSFVERR
jgi:hypothetical protein